jgi:putative AdoMet-dependent methyltransferase
MKMPEDRVDLFDSWAKSYDQSVKRDLAADAYPFAGYDDVVAAVVAAAGIESQHCVLDIGAGTGNLTAKLVELSEQVWGTDFSEEMLVKARAKVPRAHFVRWDARDAWPPEMPAQFDRIVSSYVFHEFADDVKLRLLIDLARNRLNPEGYLVIGDISFADEEAQATCRRDAANAWDDSEHYWIASRIVPQLEEAGLVVGYKQVSFCGGLFALQPKDAA